MDVRSGGYMFNFFQKTQGWEVSILIFQVSAISCIKNECAFLYDGVHDHHLVGMLPSVCAGKNMLPYCTFANPVAGCGAEKGFVVFKGMYRFFYLFIPHQSVIIAFLCNCLLQLLVINQIMLYFGSWF